jgi:hypothetical protein
VPPLLERRGTENHGRAQHGDRNAGCPHDFADLEPGCQLRREVLPLGVEAAEADDAGYAGVPGSVVPVARREPPVGIEGVDQVIGDVNAVHRRPGSGHHEGDLRPLAGETPSRRLRPQ